MSQVATLAPWALVLLAIFLIMWGIKRFITIQSPIYEGVMAVIAIITGILFLITH